MTYGELRTQPTGWVISHVIDDMCNNARYEFGKNFRKEPVSEYDLRTLQEKAVHFRESLPQSLGGAHI